MTGKKPGILKCESCGSKNMNLDEGFINELWIKCFDYHTMHIITTLVDKVKYIDTKTGIFRTGEQP